MDRVLTDMFVLGLPVIEKIARTVLVYLFIVLGLRLAGKRELAQLNPLDFTVLLTLSNAVQNAIIGEDSSVTGGIISASTLLFVNYVMVRLVFEHPKLEHLAEGAPEVLIEGGKLREDRLRRELISVTELASAARRQGFASLAEVDRAVLEPGGTLSFRARVPSMEESRFGEVIAKLEQIAEQLTALRSSGSP
ncbi:MAG TPA: YetF domain-containing protein [Myxococcota bacterium]|nr:YetF domain-containing protein [Myxococcota bacterium]